MRGQSADLAESGSRKSIAFLARSLEIGGAERQLVVLAKALHALGHRVSVHVFYSNGPLVKELTDAGVAFNGLKKKGRWDLLGFLVRTVRAISEERPDIIHSYCDVPNVVATALRLWRREAAIVWGVRSSNVDHGHYDRLSSAAFQVTRLLARFPDLIIANSQSGARYHIAKGYPSSRLCVIPNGIDTERFAPSVELRGRVRRDWGVDPNEPLIGLVGRLDPMKDHPSFLQAAAFLLGQRPEARFVCIGAGPAAYTNHLVALGHELGLAQRIQWMPASTDIPSALNALDVLVSSSSSGEGFSNVIGEAMACGVPCVVTDTGDSARIVGDTGIPVACSDPAAIASGIALLLDRRSPELSARCRKRILTQFSVEQLVDNTLAVLTGLRVAE